MILLLINENSWERLPYLLKLYQYEDEQLQFYIHKAIAKRNPFVRVSVELATFIKSTISEQQDILPKELVWDNYLVNFVLKIIIGDYYKQAVINI
ncbi:MAG TPA: hypothetical protein GX710_04450 [Clostridiales bacterium]|nr:hypothetical protein [Clostridiales bacterium]